MVFRYCKDASSNTSSLEAHVGFYRLIKGIFDPFDKKLISLLITRISTHDSRVLEDTFDIVGESCYQERVM